MKKTRLRNPDINKVDLVPAGAQQLSRITIMKSKEVNSMSKVNKQIPDDKLDKLEELLVALASALGVEDETAEKEVPAVTDNEEDNKDKGQEAETNEEDNGVAKADPTVLKKMADLEKANKELLKKMADLESEKISKEFISKAATMKSLPGATEDELAEVLKSVSINCQEQYAKLENILKSANVAIEKGGLFQEQGSDLDDTIGDSADAIWARLEKMAQDRVAKGTSNVNAMQEVLKSPEGSTLYAKYKKARGK